MQPCRKQSNTRVTRTIFVSVIAASIASNCVAMTDYFELPLEQLLQIRVQSVSKKDERLAEAPAAVFVLTHEEIMRSGVTTIPDALRMVPGVQVARADSNSWAISIRGFNSTLANKLLVLIDGRSIYNPVFGGTLWEAHDVMLEDIDRIEVIRGPGGTLWGANAVNGVINITTKHSRTTQGTTASAIYDNEERDVHARHGGTLNNNGHYRVYASGFKRDSSSRPGGGETYDEWDGVRTGFRTDWADEFTLQGDAYRTDTQQMRVDHSLIPPYSPARQQTIRYEGVNLLGRWTKAANDKSQFSVQAYIDWAKRDEPYNFIDDRLIYDLEAQYNFAPGTRHEIIVGGGLRYLEDDKTGNNNVQFDPQKSRMQLYHFFVQDKMTLAANWLLTIGSKFEHNEFSGHETQPNLRLQWNPNERYSIWSAISRAVRTPTAIEEDLTSTLATVANARLAIEPNNDFRSEELTAYELGYRQQITPKISWDFSTFYNDYDHLTNTTIQTPRLVNNGRDPFHLFIPVQFTNNMSGITEGAEMAIHWAVQQKMKIGLNYSYLNIKLDAPEPAQESAELLSPQHQAGLTVFYNLSDNWTLDTSANYVGKLVTTDSYIRWDVNLGGQLSKQIRFNLVGQNLADSKHMEFGSAADINAAIIERSVLAKITWQW